jgi:hypothetical protein
MGRMLTLPLLAGIVGDQMNRQMGSVKIPASSISFANTFGEHGVDGSDCLDGRP